MATALLVIIYLFFISLGVPDSLFGTAWPVMYRELELPVSWAGIVSMLCCAGTIVSSLASGRIISRLGTGRVAVFSTLLTALALLGYRCSPCFWCICLCAIPLGLGAGCVDTALNNYVALHYTAAQMSYLHCFYGVGVSLSPFFMSLVISGPKTWRGGYEIAFFLQLAIALVGLLTLPLWKTHASPSVGERSEPEAKNYPLSRQAKRPEIRAVWLVFLASVGLECSAGNWAATFLVDYKLLTADTAAEIVVLYYAGMALGRFLSGVLASRLAGWPMIKLGLGIALAAIILLALPFGPALSAFALFFIGLGNGPVYPNLTYLTPINFGREKSQSVVGSQMAFANTGALLAPPLFGIIGRSLGVGLLPWYLLALFALMASGVLYASAKLDK